MAASSQPRACGPRSIACLVVALAAVVAPRPLPRSIPGRIALTALAGLLGWTIVSREWAPVVGVVNADAQRLALYLAALVAATALLRDEPRDGPSRRSRPESSS